MPGPVAGSKGMVVGAPTLEGKRILVVGASSGIGRAFALRAIQEGALTALNIALEHFHSAVADRKALLMSLSQNLRAATGAQFRATGT